MASNHNQAPRAHNKARSLKKVARTTGAMLLTAAAASYGYPAQADAVPSVAGKKPAVGEHINQPERKAPRAQVNGLIRDLAKQAVSVYRDTQKHPGKSNTVPMLTSLNEKGTDVFLAVTKYSDHVPGTPPERFYTGAQMEREDGKLAPKTVSSFSMTHRIQTNIEPGGKLEPTHGPTTLTLYALDATKDDNGDWSLYLNYQDVMSGQNVHEEISTVGRFDQPGFDSLSRDARTMLDVNMPERFNTGGHAAPPEQP